MADHSKIEWTEATWNPTTGCHKTSPGCKNCYAKREWQRLSANSRSVYYGRKFEDVAEHPERLEQVLRWSRPRQVFVVSMGDPFDRDVRVPFIADLFAHMAYARQHTFQLLTKQAERMRLVLTSEEFLDEYDNACSLACHAAEEILGQRGEFDPNARRTDDIRAFDPAFPLANVWLGTSVENQEWANERRAAMEILAIERWLTWVSYEPALGQVDWNGWEFIRWLVSGGESGPKARPSHPEWHRAARDWCAANHIAYFFKQWGAYGPACDYYDDDDHRDAALDQPHELLTREGWIWKVGTPGTGEHHDGQPPSGTWVMHRVGKKLAGRDLDGRTHDEYPA